MTIFLQQFSIYYVLSKNINLISNDLWHCVDGHISAGNVFLSDSGRDDFLKMEVLLFTSIKFLHFSFKPPISTNSE